MTTRRSVIHRSDGGLTVVFPAPKSRRGDTTIVQGDVTESLDEGTYPLQKHWPDTGTVLLNNYTYLPDVDGTEIKVWLEAEDEWLERVFEKALHNKQKNDPGAVRLADIDQADLPKSRRFRNCWRPDADGCPCVDVTLARQQIEDEARTWLGRRKAARMQEYQVAKLVDEDETRAQAEIASLWQEKQQVEQWRQRAAQAERDADEDGLNALWDEVRADDA